MTDTNDRNETRDETRDETGPTRKSSKGGFGQFSDQYRDRWAANHPNKRKATDAAAADVQAPDASAPVENGDDSSATRPGE